MAYTTINKSTDYFNTVLYTGNASGQTITGVGHQPDFIWVKGRADDGYDHSLHNSASGVLKKLASNKTDAEVTNTDTITSTNADGFVLGADTAGPAANSVNQDTKTYVAWNWKAGTTSGLSGGTITPSAYSINTTAGFGIYKYSGNATAGATIAHGLGAKPHLIIVKILNTTDNWCCYHQSLGATKRFELNNSTTPTTSSTLWNDTEPTSTVFSLGTNGQVNGNGNTYIAYVFTEKAGYSKMGKYTGNGNADGAFVYTGFKPKILMLRNITNGNRNLIFDSKRLGYNPDNYHLGADVNLNEESAWGNIDLLSNGFKGRSTDGSMNANNNEYIFWAFGQTLVGTNNIPATAR